MKEAPRPPPVVSRDRQPSYTRPGSSLPSRGKEGSERAMRGGEGGPIYEWRKRPARQPSDPWRPSGNIAAAGIQAGKIWGSERPGRWAGGSPLSPALFRVFPCTAQAFGNISKLETQLYFDYSSPSLTEVTLELGGRRKQHLGPVPGIALKDGCDRDLGLRGPGLDQQGRGWLVPGKRSCGHRLTDSSGKAESPGLASLGRGGPRAECPARRWMT